MVVSTNVVNWNEGRMVALVHGPGKLTCFVSRSIPFVDDCRLRCYDLSSD